MTIEDYKKKTINLRQAYKAALTTEDGVKVCRDLVKRYIIADPVGENADVTLINIGAQRAVVAILQKVYGSDDAIRKAIEESYKQHEQIQSE